MIFSITVSVLIIVIVIIIVVLMWSLLSPSFSLLSSTFLLSPSVLIVIVIIVITNAALLLCNRPRSPRSLCGSVVKYRRAKSERLRFDSQRGLRSFSLSHARDKTKKKYFFILIIVIDNAIVSINVIFFIISHCLCPSVIDIVVFIICDIALLWVSVIVIFFVSVTVIAVFVSIAMVVWKSLSLCLSAKELLYHFLNQGNTLPLYFPLT